MSDNLGCLGFLLAPFVQRPSVPSESFFYSKRPLLTHAELSFFKCLQQVCPHDFLVFTKVRLADLIKTSFNPDSSRTGAFNRIALKHIDFVICRKSDLGVVLLIELDDSSHSSKAAIKRDHVKTRALESAGLKLVRITARRSYSLPSLASELGFESFFEN